MEVEAEKIAREFHYSYEGLAPAFSYETREASRVPWCDVPEANRLLMIATVGSLLARGVITAGEQTRRG